MNTPSHKTLTPLIRLLGLVWLTLGAWLLIANIAESAYEFNPAYLKFYFYSQLLRPLLALAIGVLLMVCSKRLSRWLGKGLED